MSSNTTPKVPSQVFRWFEKMKNNYEHSLSQALSRFERYASSQQLRVDNAYTDNINHLKQQHQASQTQNNERINDLQKDINFYKNQIAEQQKTIEQLNTRYDAVMKCLLAEHKDLPNEFFADTEKVIPGKDSKLTDATVAQAASSYSIIEADQENNATTNAAKINEMFEQAINYRASGQYDDAFLMFEHAALKGHVKAMGAMGRSYFLGEGCELDPIIGLAWLICAAHNELPQAVSRVEQIKEQDTELYDQALHYNLEHLQQLNQPTTASYAI